MSAMWGRGRVPVLLFLRARHAANRRSLCPCALLWLRVCAERPLDVFVVDDDLGARLALAERLRGEVRSPLPRYSSARYSSPRRSC